MGAVKSLLVAIYEDEEKLLDGAKLAKKFGAAIHDVFSPFPIHGIDEVIGIRRSRLPILCFVACTVGGLFALAFQIWTSASSWPLNIGGKPFNSFPAFIPVAFEMTILVGGLVTVVACLLRSKLFLGKKEMLLDPRVTDDHFVLAIHMVDASIDYTKLEMIIKKCGASTTTTRVVQ